MRAVELPELNQNQKIYILDESLNHLDENPLIPARFDFYDPKHQKIMVTLPSGEIMVYREDATNIYIDDEETELGHQELMSSKELGDFLLAWKVDNSIIQHKPENRDWYDLTDAQVIKELVHYNMLEGNALYRIKPTKEKYYV